MKKIALLFDRGYVDAHFCFTELAKHLVDNGFLVDLFYIANPYNPAPAFYNDKIRIFSFPLSKFQKFEFWTKVKFYKEHKYCAVFGTPIKGVYLAYKVAKSQKIPLIYLADEVYDPKTKSYSGIDYDKDKKKDIKANKYAKATIALSKEYFDYQKKINNLPNTHKFFIIPNSPAGKAKRLRSNYFRDIFNINDSKPIILFIGTIYWRLAQKIYEETKNYKDKDYHIIFHGRTKGLIGDKKHPFIKTSDTPLPSNLVNYAVSSADIGLVLYDKNNIGEYYSGKTSGKSTSYLKNKIPIIAGNIEFFKDFEEKENIGIFWNGKDDIDKIITKAISKKEEMSKNIPNFYEKNYDYSKFFKPFNIFLKEII